MVLEYIKKYKEEINACINDLKHKDTFYKQIPNLLTFLRLIGGIPAGLIYYLNSSLSISIIAFLWFTDAVDGRIAKKFNIQSKIGADMDAFADKIMFLGSSVPLLSNIPTLILNFVFEGVISAINVYGRMKELNTKTVLSGKIKTVSLAITLVSGYLVQFFGLSSSILNILIPLTTGLQLIAIKDYIVEFKKLEDNKKKDNKNNNVIETEFVRNNEEEIDKTYTNNKTKSTILELKHNRDLLLRISEQNEVITKKRSRKIKREERKN